uniref:Uncharacterized protein n=1 Tax=Anguilla anguilla TaxID=7936 RepID=A0A0E9UZM5_ANGAN
MAVFHSRSSTRWIPIRLGLGHKMAAINSEMPTKTA